MDAIHKIEHWADTHHPIWLDYLRVALGLFILYKGLIFIMDTNALTSILEGSSFGAFANQAWVHIVAFAHLMGGLLIAMGLLTRFAVALQIPILVGAILFVNAQTGFFSAASNLELEISLIVLAALVVFLIYGSGKFSVDEYMRKHPHS